MLIKLLQLAISAFEIPCATVENSKVSHSLSNKSGYLYPRAEEGTFTLAIENIISSFSQREDIVERISFLLRVVFPKWSQSD